MATTGGRADPALKSVLFDEAYRFEFFRAVRLLERLSPDRRPVGTTAHAGEEVVRFQSPASLSFPASTIADLRGTDDAAGIAPRMLVTFMGLTGPSGALPRHYTELIIGRLRQKDDALREFFDLFTHRFVSLFYRAWVKHRVAVGLERAQRDGLRSDRFAHYLAALFGFGTEGLQDRLAVEDRALLFYTGLLADHRRSATGLRNLLSDYFGIPVRIVQFVGQWLGLTPPNRSCIGHRGWNKQLGANALAGSRIWDQHAAFRVRIGPLSLVMYTDLLPDGSAFPALVQLTRLFAGQQFDFDIQLVLRAAEVPRCRLGAKGIGAPRLGWAAWLKTAEFTADADDAVFGGALTHAGALPD